MTAASEVDGVDPDDDLWEDLEDAIEETSVSEKAGAKPLARSAKQEQAITAHQAQTAAVTAASRTAQIANLLISGETFESIGASIGATASEVEQMLLADTARYVRTQPALRQWTRRFLSEKYTGLLEAVYDQAVDKNHRDQLAYHDRARGTLKDLARLHGADAPTQAEVTIDATPATVQAVVDRIAAAQGLSYDVDIFDIDDVVDAEEVHEMAEQDHKALEQAEQAVDAEQQGDEPL